MTIDLESRRSIRKISGADFAAYPVWEWAINEESHGHGESFLRPTSLDSIPPGLVRHYVVSAVVTLSDGSTVPACVEVDVRTKMVHYSPMFIVLQERHLDLGGAEAITALSLYTRQADTRPVSWQLAVTLEGSASAPGGRFARSLLSRLRARLRRGGLLASRSSILVP
ncbi:MAG: hypothetical protein H7335_03680 [Massilia sp.]|nr:hypothetical protein [Massilia sp.]